MLLNKSLRNLRNILLLTLRVAARQSLVVRLEPQEQYTRKQGKPKNGNKLEGGGGGGGGGGVMCA